MLVRVLDSWLLTRVRAGSSGYPERGVEPRAAGGCGRGHSQPLRQFRQQSRGDFVCKFWSACLSSLQSLPPSRSCAVVSPLHHLQASLYVLHWHLCCGQELLRCGGIAALLWVLRAPGARATLREYAVGALWKACMYHDGNLKVVYASGAQHIQDLEDQPDCTDETKRSCRYNTNSLSRSL